MYDAREPRVRRAKKQSPRRLREKHVRSSAGCPQTPPPPPHKNAFSSSPSPFSAAALPLSTLVGLFDRADPANVHADAGVKFQSFAAGRGFRVAKHHADFFANLVRENTAGSRLGNQRGEFAERRAHQPGLGSDRDIANFSFQLG